MMKAGIPIAALAAAYVMLAPASADVLDSVTADQLESALSAAGLNPNMIQEANNGFPVATGKAGEFAFYIRGLSCSGSPSACENLVFFANFELGRAVTDNDYRIVNNFNDSQVFGRAYVLQNTGEVGVDYVIELGGGVTEEHLAENIGRWADVIAAFVDKFREGLSSS
jgi:hypothetical protein